MMTEEQLVQDAETVERERFIKRARVILVRLTDAERLSLLDNLFDGYCRNCGTPDPHCQCANDE